MKFWYLLHYRASNTQTSLHKCAYSPEPSLLAYTGVQSKDKDEDSGQ